MYIFCISCFYHKTYHKTYHQLRKTFKGVKQIRLARHRHTIESLTNEPSEHPQEVGLAGFPEQVEVVSQCVVGHEEGVWAGSQGRDQEKGIILRTEKERSRIIFFIFVT